MASSGRIPTPASLPHETLQFSLNFPQFMRVVKNHDNDSNGPESDHGSRRLSFQAWAQIRFPYRMDSRGLSR
jgi:hypothetical protein